MPYSHDPEDWTPDYYMDRTFVRYKLKPHELRAVETIRKNLKNKAYKNCKNCAAHLSLLGKIANKLKLAISNERTIGRTNWQAEETYSDIKKLHEQLENLLDELRK